MAAKASRSCSAPSSRLSEVTRQPSIPQGTIHSKGCRSLLTLIARPWVVTPRLTCTPIEPIFRADGPITTGDMLFGPSAVGGDPDPGQALDRRRLDAVLGERGDRDPLEAAHVLVDVVAVGPQRDDRVGDELAGPVVGDAAAAVGVADLDPLHLVPLGPHRQLLRARAAPAGVDGGVLEQQQHVGDRLLLARRLQPALRARASS